MSWQDIVNAGYESIGGFMILLHCLALYRDKEVKGVSVFATVVFTTWGYWNLYYYPHLNQWASFAGGIVIVTANTLWIAMMFYYIRKAKREKARALEERKRIASAPRDEAPGYEAGPRPGETFGEYIGRIDKAGACDFCGAIPPAPHKGCILR